IPQGGCAHATHCPAQTASHPHPPNAIGTSPTPTSRTPTSGRWKGRPDMTAKAIAVLTGVLLLIGMCCLGAAVIGAGGVAIAACANPAPSLTGATPGSPPAAPAGGWPAVGQWSSAQVGNAAVIVAVGQQLHVPPRG